MKCLKNVKVVEVVKENVDGVMRLGCSVGGGIDQDEMMNPFSEGKFKSQGHS